MKTVIKFNLLLALLFVISSSYAQKRLANRFFKSFDYVKASELYEKAAKRGDSSLHVLTRAGDCYWFNSDPVNASIWYKSAIERYQEIAPKYVYRYIQTQLSQEAFDEVAKWRGIYQERYSSNADYLPLGSSAELEDLVSTQGKYIRLENLAINSKYSDFGGYEHKGAFYFASARRKTGELYGWNEQPYLDLYKSNMTNGEINKPILFPGNINTMYHESSLAITADDSTLYFTRVNLKRRDKLDPDNQGTTHLTLYSAERDGNGRWVNITKLPFNEDTSSTGHPALSADGKRLYFISDREGGYGETDLYYVDISEDGYGDPINLGASVNTKGREMFPFVSQDNTLYFSSDGYVSIGLLDIFKTHVLKDQNAKIENLGAPINSGYDDFAFYLRDDDPETGYLSSNRKGGLGSDDIYSFTSYECDQTLIVQVIDARTKEVLSDAQVQLIDAQGMILQTLTTDPQGSVTSAIDCNKSFNVLGKKADYKEALVTIVTDTEDAKQNTLVVELEPLIIGDEIVINPVYFDFDKWDIRTDAQYELENVVEVLRNHPNMVIAIESHTDSRGNDAYNRWLSDKRAKSTKAYILSQGIPEAQIESAKGYGESQLLNNCSNGVKCSEEAHQLNRRSVFRIIEE